MFNNAVFKVAFAISVSVHLLAISSGSFFHPKIDEQKNDIIEVTYILPEEVKEEVLKTLPKEYDLEKKRRAFSSKKIIPSENANVSKNTPAIVEQYLEEKSMEELDEYIEYYELIREKIKKYVAKNYTRPTKEGRVDVTFTLSRNGILEDILIDVNRSANNIFLRNAALRSVKQASPFPPFPNSLEGESLAFSIAIIFKK